MKETIYTIPINDAFDSNCSCPICFIEQKLNSELVEASVGAAMMEPDHRENTNIKGFCKTHIVQMYHQQKALPLALVLQSYISKQNNNILNLMNNKNDKKSFFKGKNSSKEACENVVKYISDLENSCAICDQLSYSMTRYIKNTIYMWKSIPEFRVKFNNNSCFCMPHLKMLLVSAMENLNNREFDEFFNIITKSAKNTMTSVYNNITEFVNSFDYRNTGELSQNAAESTKTAIKKFIGADV